MTLLSSWWSAKSDWRKSGTFVHRSHAHGIKILIIARFKECMKRLKVSGNISDGRIKIPLISSRQNIWDFPMSINSYSFYGGNSPGHDWRETWELQRSYCLLPGVNRLQTDHEYRVIFQTAETRYWSLSQNQMMVIKSSSADLRHCHTLPPLSPTLHWPQAQHTAGVAHNDRCSQVDNTHQ